MTSNTKQFTAMIQNLTKELDSAKSKIRALTRENEVLRQRLVFMVTTATTSGAATTTTAALLPSTGTVADASGATTRGDSSSLSPLRSTTGAVTMLSQLDAPAPSSVAAAPTTSNATTDATSRRILQQQQQHQIDSLSVVASKEKDEDEDLDDDEVVEEEEQFSSTFGRGGSESDLLMDSSSSPPPPNQHQHHNTSSGGIRGIATLTTAAPPRRASFSYEGMLLESSNTNVPLLGGSIPISQNNNINNSNHFPFAVSSDASKGDERSSVLSSVRPPSSLGGATLALRLSGGGGVSSNGGGSRLSDGVCSKQWRRRVEVLERREQFLQEQLVSTQRQLDALTQQRLQEVTALEAALTTSTERIRQLQDTYEQEREATNQQQQLALSRRDPFSSSVNAVTFEGISSLDQSVSSAGGGGGLARRRRSFVVLRQDNSKGANSGGDGSATTTNQLVAHLPREDLEEMLLYPGRPTATSAVSASSPLTLGTGSGAAGGVLDADGTAQSATANPKVPVAENPNVLGDVVADGQNVVRNKRWYVVRVIRAALRRVAQRTAFRPSDSPLSVRPTLQPLQPAAIQLMIKENLELHFYLRDNRVVISEGGVAPVGLPSLRSQNSDPVLLAAFDSQPTSSSQPNNSNNGTAGGVSPSSGSNSNFHHHHDPAAAATIGTPTMQRDAFAGLDDFDNNDGGANNNNNDATQSLSSTIASRFTFVGARADQVRIIFPGPVFFAYLRQYLSFDTESFVQAVESAVWRESSSPGKSDAAMYFFGNYVVKSVKEHEYRFLKDTYLAAFGRYAEQNPYTLLPRFYFLFSLYWLKKGQRRHFVVMNNVFWTKHYINRIYDVKGSTAGREANIHEGARTAYGALLLKDNDLPLQLIICGPLRRATILAQLRSDTAFLSSLSIVDYSLIIGVRSRKSSRQDRHRRTATMDPSSLTAASSVESQSLLTIPRGTLDAGTVSLPIYAEDDATTVREDTYYLGLIDVLQTYTPQKRLEHFAKGLLIDRHTISIVPPSEFSERLCKLIERITV